MGSTTLGARASTLKGLHQPGKPVILANVYDIPSARTVAALPGCKALASASYAVALAAGTEDKLLTLEANLDAARDIGKVAAEFDKPFTVDLQDGYGDRLEAAIEGIIDRGAVGCNLEDCDTPTNALFPPEVAVDRIKRALATAKAKGVADFVVNARCDVLLHGGEIDEVYRRGKRYLEAGATTVFVLGGSQRGGLKKEEVQSLVREFQGRVNVSCVLAPGRLSIQEIVQLGVSRVSVGPQMLFKAQEAIKREAEGLLAGV